MPRLTDLTGQNITTQATATYAENISAGDNVKLNSSGELAKWGAGEFGASLTVDQVKSSFSGTASEYQATAYAKNRSILFIATINQTGDEQLVVVERSSLTETVTRSEFSLTGVGAISGMCFLEAENKLIILEYRNSNYEVFAYNYANSSLTLDQSVTLTGLANITITKESKVLYNADGNEVAVFGGQSNPAGAVLISVGYIAGTLTVDERIVNGSLTGGSFDSGWDSANDKGLLAYLWETGDTLYCYNVTYSGVTPTLSSAATTTLNLDNNAVNCLFDTISEEFLVIGGDGSSSGIRYTTVDISGTTPSIATVATLSTSTSTQPTDLISRQVVYDKLSGYYIIASQDPDGTNQCKILSLTGGTLSQVDETTLTTVTTTANAYTNLFYDESYQAIVLAFREPASGYEWNLAIGRLDSSNDLRDFTPDQDNLIGVAIDTKTTGQSGKYRLLDKYKGVLVKNLTGLIPGQEYYINSVGGLTTSTTSDFYGLAISSTQAITSTVVGLLTELKKLTIGKGRTISQYTGSDNTANGTYTTICDQGGSGVLKSITCSSSNHLAAPGVRVTIDGVEQDLFGSSNANVFRTHSTDDHKTWECNIPYSNGVKVEVDSSNASYTTYCTVILHQD